MHTARALATLIALLCCAPVMAQSPDQPGDIEVSLEIAAQSRLGVTTVKLAPTRAPRIIEAIGRVLDIGALAQLDAEIESAAASSHASASEAKRLELLASDDLNASRQAVEAANAQSAADAARLQFALQRLALEWGPGLASLNSQQRQELINQITAGQAALLRIDPLEPQSLTGTGVELRPDANSPPIVTESLGPATMVDPQMQTRGQLVMVRGDDASGLRPGRVLAAQIDSGQILDGVILPRSALVRIDGSTWAYLRRGDDEFVRREVVGARMQSEGWFVSAGFAPGDEIVNAGAGSLLAVERGGEFEDDD